MTGVPRFIPPCSPVPGDAPPGGPGWVHEVKFDGWRLQVHKHGDDVRFYSRNGRDLTPRFAELRDHVVYLPDCIIDAELVACDTDGKPDFQALMRKGPCSTRALSSHCHDQRLSGRVPSITPTVIFATRLHLGTPMPSRYFSERESGEVQQTVTDVTPVAWRGIAALIRTRLDDASFGARYPEMCPDGAGPCGTNEKLFWDSFHAENPAIADIQQWLREDEPPPLLQLMDFIEFCWQAMGKVRRRDYHGFFKHYHLDFDADEGRKEFEDDINRIFRRNGLAFTLTPSGEIERVLPSEIGDPLRHARFQTGDAALDTMLETARRKFLDPDEAARKEALEKLWDAWERLKTLGGQFKKAGIAALLDQAAGATAIQFRELLEAEAHQLTDAGNTFHIRHSETSQEALSNVAHVDYLFSRMFSLIYMLLRATGRLG